VKEVQATLVPSVAYVVNDPNFSGHSWHDLDSNKVKASIRRALTIYYKDKGIHVKVIFDNERDEWSQQ